MKGIDYAAPGPLIFAEKGGLGCDESKWNELLAIDGITVATYARFIENGISRR